MDDAAKGTDTQQPTFITSSTCQLSTYSANSISASQHSPDLLWRLELPHRVNMSNRRRYAVDPTVQGQPAPDAFQGYQAQQQYDQHQQQQQQQGYGQTLHQQAPPAEHQNAYGVAERKTRVWDDDLLPAPQPFVPAGDNNQLQAGEINRSATHSPLPPANHIPQPPHAAGPSLKGPKPRIDPTQVPSPIEVAEMDQNLSDIEDFQSCNTRGVIPLASTDYRGIDQGQCKLPQALTQSHQAYVCLIPSCFTAIQATPYPGTFALP